MVFKKKVSTEHALADDATAAYDNIQDNQYTGFIFIDLAEVFDATCYEFLVSKLEHYGIRVQATV